MDFQLTKDLKRNYVVCRLYNNKLFGLFWSTSILSTYTHVRSVSNVQAMQGTKDVRSSGYSATESKTYKT